MCGGVMKMFCETMDFTRFLKLNDGAFLYDSEAWVMGDATFSGHFISAHGNNFWSHLHDPSKQDLASKRGSRDSWTDILTQSELFQSTAFPTAWSQINEI